jgi:hypothetical protein
MFLLLLIFTYSIIRYLIVDYGIKEDYADIMHSTKEIEDLFAKGSLKKQLSKDLSSELHTNNQATSKKPKV